MKTEAEAGGMRAESRATWSPQEQDEPDRLPSPWPHTRGGGESLGATGKLTSAYHTSPQAPGPFPGAPPHPAS